MINSIISDIPGFKQVLTAEMGPGWDGGIADPVAQNSLGIEPKSPPEQWGCSCDHYCLGGANRHYAIHLCQKTDHVVHNLVQVGASCLCWTRRGESLKKEN